MPLLFLLKTALIVLPLFLGQGIPLSPAQTATVSGTVRTVEGKPAVGVRVAARVRPDTPDTTAGAALTSLASTDEEGRYRLEGIPPGRYYIVAGSVDAPTYYPGSTEMRNASEVRAAAGSSISTIDFVVQEISLRRPQVAGGLQFFTFSPVSIPVFVKSPGKLPIFSNGVPVVVRATRVGDGVWTEVPVGAAAIAVPLGVNSPDSFRITVHGLPEGYRIQSIKYGDMEISGGVVNLFSTARGVSVSMSSRIVPSLAGAIPQEILSRAALPSPSALTITVEGTATAKVAGGVRVAGSAKQLGRRPISLSGNPGTVYDDGTFEFLGVAPGRHLLLTRDNTYQARPFGAVVVVGEADVLNVELQAVPFLPADVPTGPRAAGSHPVGSALPLRSIRALIVDEESQQPLVAGAVRVNDLYFSSIEIVDGRVELHGLLPGRYVIDIQTLEYQRITEAVDLDDADVVIELKAKRNRPPKN